MTSISYLHQEWCVSRATQNESDSTRPEPQIRNDIILTPAKSLVEISHKLELLADDIDDDQCSIHVTLLLASIRFDVRRASSFR